MIHEEDLIAEVLEILESGPKSFEYLIGRLRTSDPDLALDPGLTKNIEGLLDNSDCLWRGPRGLYHSISQLLDGIYLSHTLTEGEIATELVDICPDLSGLDLGLEQYVLESGERLEIVFQDSQVQGVGSEFGSYRGPKGWLHGYLPGDLVVFHRKGQMLNVFKPSTLHLGEEEREALLRSFKSLYVEGRGLETTDLLIDTLCENSLIFRSPVPPISELIDQLLLEHRGQYIGPSIENWSTETSAWEAEKKAKLADDLGFGNCCTSEFELTLRVLSEWKEDKSDELGRRAALNGLAHGLVALGFSRWAFQFGCTSFQCIEDLMGVLASSKSPKSAAPLYVRAIARSLQGKALLAEHDVVDALRRDPSFELAKRELANYFADRGDLLGYISQLQSCVSQEVARPLAEADALLANFPPVAPEDRCLCRSGKRYKSCCAVFQKLSPQVRRAWMAKKVMQWMSRPERTEVLSDYCSVFENSLQDANADQHIPMVVDVAMFEGRGMAEYLDLRRELLCDEDRVLLENLLNTKRSIFEIVDVTPGQSLLVKDYLNGQTALVVDHALSVEMHAGELVVSRVFDDIDGMFFFGQPLKITQRQRDSLLEILPYGPDPYDFLIWLAATLRPPELLNSGGEEIVFCSTRVRPVDIDNARLAITKAFRQTDPDRWILVEQEREANAMIISIEEKEVIVETNSVVRMARALERLACLIGSYEVVEQHERSVAVASHDKGAEFIDEDRETLPLELSKHLDVHIEKRENDWLDESLPALGGITPRQALNDPTKRVLLIRLLNEFERNELRTISERGSYSGFTARRIRRKLGL